ncbi:FIST signal transduction protein [Rhodohalobacter mucosus]|uniref:Small ligand-binding sensory domain FIST n=1 Tax=Rhodohalobacter mucosus TaxID=2079485 RepID=A0A316TZV9_9BACT|nr:FIST N-terminal domain-containing protein [Rhodohalobacter mucosus]PWN05776.1 hypothetical protein DDZ15_11295 [Rhodohalobacter mucosus]
MKSISIHGTSPDEIRSALKQCLSNGFSPTLAFVFMSIKQDRKKVRQLLGQHNIDIFGVTSCGEFINNHQSEGEIVIMLLDLDRDTYSVLFEDIGNRTIESAANMLAEKSLQTFSNPCLILCSTGVTDNGEFFDGMTLVHSLEQALGPERIFFGGMAGDDMSLTGTRVFSNESETDYGIIAAVLNADRVSLTGMAITGWQPMGISRKVTKSEGKLLYTIDDKPAVEMYLKYLGKADMANNREFELLDELSFSYPFIVERDESGETLIKSPISIDHDERALVMDIEMQEGDVFCFSMPPDLDISQRIIDEAEQIKSEMNADRADSLLIFSCAGRPPVLGPLVTIENEGLTNVWNSPMAGFFTYGEFGRVKNGRQHFHSTACCWVALNEKT